MTRRPARTRSTPRSDDCSIRPHPHHLHAAAALWSLVASREQLRQAAVAEAQFRGVVQDDAGVRSPTYGTRGAGGHSDPVPDFLFARVRPNRAAQLAERITDTLAWLAGELCTNEPTNARSLALVRIQSTLPTLQPATAANLHRWLAEADQQIRTHLGLAPDRQPLPGTACPSCAVRQVYVQTSAPNRARWTIICAAGCTCAGETCTCGMLMRAEGVHHIWAAGSSLLDNIAA
jgi:hypothetical protein